MKDGRIVENGTSEGMWEKRVTPLDQNQFELKK
jgi:hypothetical protein